MRMFGVGIRRVVVIMVMVMVMVMMVMIMVVMMMVRHRKTAHASAEGITKRAVRDVRARCVGTLPFNVVVVAFLNCAHFTLEP